MCECYHIGLLLLLTDLAGSTAVCVQTAFPGAHVHEHCSTHDDCVEMIPEMLSYGMEL